VVNQDIMKPVGDFPDWG